ncbi:MAG: BON domain-containing protein, partial [Chloroflexi bacterium]|nr:BON domain-containing protein [Chloroflexota bacterium]
MKTDAEIQQAVIQELRWDPRIAETDVGVEVDRSVVTLTGTVRSYAKQMAAQEAAHRVAGVRDVANDIRVKLPGDATRTDTEIAQAVRNVLEWHAFVPDERIRSTVSDGYVILEGDVDFWQQREDAEHAVRNLAIVRGVDNRILVKPPPIDAESVRTEIEAALERRAARAAKHLT